MFFLLTLEKERAQKIEFLSDVGLGMFSSNSVLLERAKMLNINMSIPYFACVVSCCHEDKHLAGFKSIEVLIGDFLDSLSVPCLCWCSNKFEANVFAYMRPDAVDRKSYSVNIGKSIYSHLTKVGLGSEIKIGIGTFYDDNINLHKSLLEAIQAIHIGPLFACDSGIYHYDEIGIFQILLPLAGTETASRYVNSFLGKLIQHDKLKKSQLVLTLEQLIICDSLKAAASNLFVHPKTLSLRKARIEEILGVSLSSEEVKLTLSEIL